VTQAGLTLAVVGEALRTNVDLTRRNYELWNDAGVEAMVEHVWAPDVVLYEPPELPDTGVFRGAEEVAAHMRAVRESMGHLHLTVRSLEERGAYVLATMEISGTGESSRVALTMPFFQVLRWAEGRVQELRSYFDGEQARRDYERLSA
jgi:ketosteroid isomerase-like protein